jgi:outer membrane protein OmpA-like peptidoglycan-associated protein
VQESESKEQKTGAKKRRRESGIARGWRILELNWQAALALLDYRNYLQPSAHAVFISDSAKITRPGSFSLTRNPRQRYNVLLANDLDLPWFGIRPVIYTPGVEYFGTPFFLDYRWSGARMLPHLEDVEMKNRLFVALLLAGVLALPALAQQAAPTTQDQPAAAAGASGKPALQPDTHEGFWGKINPFARKKYVQRQTAPIRDRVNELDELTSSNTKMIKDTDSRAQAGIQLASTKANEADQHAIDAGNKAQMAQQTATQANTRLTTVEQVVGNIDQYKASNQTEIRFRPGQSVLSTNAKAALDDMATPLKDQRGYIVEVQGFSSGHGQAAIATSQKMADAVVRYLVLNHEIPVYRIYVVGMGNAPVPAAAGDDAKTKRTSGGRVEISLLKNDLETLASTSAAPVPATQDQPAPPK